MTEITSYRNNNISLYKLLNLKRSEREKAGLFTFEGEKLFEEALESGVNIERVFVTEELASRYRDILVNIEAFEKKIFILPESLMEKVSDTVSPQGILCIAKTLDKSFTIDKIVGGRYFLFLCGVSDPGNMGTMIRTAEALGFDGMILSGDSCDIYSPKVVRSAMGSIFRLPFLVTENPKSLTEKFNERGISTCAAVVSGGKTVSDVNNNEPMVLYVGNESRGLPEGIVGLCRHKLTIKMNKNVQSLNAAVAAGILMWEFIR